MKPRIFTILSFALPCAVLFAVHYNALRTWFFMDDFAWLGLKLELHQPSDLWSILFEPRAQGTVRTLSERLFFLVFSSVFGMKAIWFHYWVFLTHCGSLLFANAIVRRLSGSAMAGVAAATAWAISPATSVSLAWLSAYNEILCGFLMLAAFYCLIRYTQDGGRRFWILQWAAYLPSFFALEVTVVYPAVAFALVWLTARQYWKKVLWLWLPSLLFVMVHFLLIPKDPVPAYKMTFGPGMFGSLWRYAFKAVGPGDLMNFTEQPPAPLGWWMAALMMVLLAGFLLWRATKRDYVPALGAVWFVCLLGPVLPLQNHFSDYYVTIASFGIAMLMGWAFGSAMNGGWAARIATIAFVGVFCWCQAVQAGLMEQWYRTHSAEMRNVLEGIEGMVKRRPIDTLILAGVDNDVFISGMLDNPFRLYGIAHAYLTPGGEKLIRQVPLERNTMRLDRVTANRLIDDDKTVVASYDGRKLADVTSIYRAIAAGEIRLTSLRTNDTTWFSRLGTGWYAEENGFRWMQRRATVELDTPAVSTGVRVVVGVYCPQTLLDPVAGKLQMRVYIDGHAVGVQPLTEGQLDLVFEPIPPEYLQQRRQVEITLEMSHVVVPPADGRELGAAVFSISLKAP